MLIADALGTRDEPARVPLKDPEQWQLLHHLWPIDIIATKYRIMIFQVKCRSTRT